MGCLQKLYCSTFCCCCTLQSGVLLAVVIYTTIFFGMLIMTSYTMTVRGAWTMKNFCLSLAYGHATFIILGIFHAFCGAFQESPKCMRAAACFMTIAFIIYISASALSYMTNYYEYACVIQRCPDSIWMQDSGWRHNYFEENHSKNRNWNCFSDYGRTEKSSSNTAFHNKNNEGIYNQLGSALYTMDQNERYNRHQYQQDTRANKSERNFSTAIDMGNQFNNKHQKDVGTFRDLRIVKERNPLITLRKIIKSFYFENNGNKIPFVKSNMANKQNRITKSDSKEDSVQNVKFPLIGLFLSSVLNFLYTVFLLYIIITFIAYENELRDGLPRGFTKDEWSVL